MQDFTVRQVKTQRELDQCFDIRTQVFVIEQNVPTDIEMDEFDIEAEHFLAYYNRIPIGCARIRRDDCVKMERVAILKSFRNKGFGKKLTEYLINYCKQHNINEICIHSQLYVSDFYTKFGFKKRGQTFYEAGIEHIKMVLLLK